MAVKKKRLTSAAVSFMVLMAVIVTQLLGVPQKAYAAGTDLYVGYSGKSNNYSTVQEAVNPSE